MSKVGDRIRALRIKRGLTQTELADAISKSMGIELKRSALGNYERGIRIPDLDTIEAFADYFDTSIADLMGRDEDDSALREKLDHVGKSLTAPSRSKEWRMLSEGFERFEKNRKAEFQMVFNMLSKTYPEFFSEGDNDDDPES
jgi:transcriptional regulator with XRE-family HTH domain